MKRPVSGRHLVLVSVGEGKVSEARFGAIQEWRQSGMAPCLKQENINIAVLDLLYYQVHKFYLRIREHIYAGV
jgi:hypothetical protein